MKNVVLIGSGNVATSLGIALKNNGFIISQVYSRSLKNAKKLANILTANHTSDLNKIKAENIAIVCVKDDVLRDVLSKIKNKDIVHTSGAHDINIFSDFHKNCGVIYPLQSFAKNIVSDISTSPLCIEANNKKFENDLKKIANLLSNNVVIMNSHQRKQLHIAAVFGCNFSNHMMVICNRILTENNIKTSIMSSIIEKSLLKLKKYDAKEIQSGPAKRGDINTINNHLKAIKNDKIKKIYKLISEHIINEHK